MLSYDVIEKVTPILRLLQNRITKIAMKLNKIAIKLNTLSALLNPSATSGVVQKEYIYELSNWTILFGTFNPKLFGIAMA